jgi:hypothetical protein
LLVVVFHPGFASAQAADPASGLWDEDDVSCSPPIGPADDFVWQPWDVSQEREAPPAWRGKWCSLTPSFSFSGARRLRAFASSRRVAFERCYRAAAKADGEWGRAGTARLEIAFTRDGVVTRAKVSGSGSDVLDRCLSVALSVPVEPKPDKKASGTVVVEFAPAEFQFARQGLNAMWTCE